MPTITTSDAGMVLDITTLTLVHTIISIVAIAAGLVVVGGLIAAVRIDGWTGIFLVTTALTSITGFFFPFTQLLASHWVGIISLIILPFVIAARYWKELRGAWRGIYVVGTVLVLYLNFFILNVQLFRRNSCLDRGCAQTDRAAVRADPAPGAGAVRLARFRRLPAVPSPGGDDGQAGNRPRSRRIGEE
jgi:hypothetical protein